MARLLFVLVLLSSPRVSAEQVGGALVGVVTDKKTKDPIAGATVVVLSPELTGTQAAITDSRGHYQITGLPSGTYTVTFTFGDQTVTRLNVKVVWGSWKVLHSIMDLNSSSCCCCILRYVPPMIDPSNSSAFAGSAYDYAIRRIPWPSLRAHDLRFAGLGAIARGSQISYLAGDPTENHFLLDDLALPSGRHGSFGASAIPSEFIEEIIISDPGDTPLTIPGGGALTQITSRSGNNYFRGSVFGSLASGNNQLPSELGATAAGPLKKDRAWFFIGVAPRFFDSGARSTPFILNLHGAAAPEHQGNLHFSGTPLYPAGAKNTPDVAEPYYRASAHWSSKFLDNKMNLRARLGWLRGRFRSTQLADRALAAVDARYHGEALGKHELKTGLDTYLQPASGAENPSPGLAGMGAFLSDSWQLIPNFTINAGIRYDELRAKGQGGGARARGTSPRLSAIYDWTEEARAKVFVYWARYENPLTRPKTREFGTGVQYELFEDFAIGTAVGRRNGKNAVTATTNYRATRRSFLQGSYTHLRDEDNPSPHIVFLRGYYLIPLDDANAISAGLRYRYGGVANARVDRLELDDLGAIHGHSFEGRLQFERELARGTDFAVYADLIAASSTPTSTRFGVRVDF